MFSSIHPDFWTTVSRLCAQIKTWGWKECPSECPPFANRLPIAVRGETPEKEAMLAVGFESNTPERKQAAAFDGPEITPHFPASVSLNSFPFFFFPGKEPQLRLKVLEVQSIMLSSSRLQKRRSPFWTWHQFRAQTTQVASPGFGNQAEAFYPASPHLVIQTSTPCKAPSEA